MKRTILLLLVAVLSVATMSAQETRKATYVIDGKVVADFDGSQLKGATIVSYTIEPETNIHAIFTSKYDTGGQKIGGVKILTSTEDGKEVTSGETTSESIKIKSTEEVVYVLDGKVVPFSDIKDMPSSKIASMEVIKDKENLKYIKYANEAKVFNPKAIIKITTK